MPMKTLFGRKGALRQQIDNRNPSGQPRALNVTACSAGFPHGLQQFSDKRQISASEESFVRRVASVISALNKERMVFGDSAALEKTSGCDCGALTHSAWAILGNIRKIRARKGDITH
jgi:hypothetical protein